MMLATLTRTPTPLVTGTHPALTFQAKWITPYHPRRFNAPKWMDQALCAQLPPEESDPLFFGAEHRQAPAALIVAANKAREICSCCPVLATCLTYALMHDERYGVWAGTSGRQREKLRARLSAGASVGELVAECLDGS